MGCSRSKPIEPGGESHECDGETSSRRSRDSLVEELHEALRSGDKHLTEAVGNGKVATGDWGRNLTTEVALQRFSALVEAFDALMKPLEEAIERSLEGREHTLKELLESAREAASTFQRSKELTRLAITAMSLDKWRRDHTERRHPGTYACSLDRVFGLANEAISRQVGLGSSPEFARHMAHLRAVTETLSGQPPEDLFPTIRPESRLTCAHCHLVANRGERAARLEVVRERCLESAAEELERGGWLARQSGERQEGAPKIFPVFRGKHTGREDGEGHGPRRELFSRVGEELKQSGLLCSTATSWWFDTSSPDTPASRRKYASAGFLMGCCLNNLASLQLHFAPSFFELVLADPDRASAPHRQLRDIDPEAANATCRVYSMHDADFQSLLRADELEPMSRTEYVRQSAESLLLERPAWRLDELRRGFRAAFPPGTECTLHLLPEDLQAAVAGSSEREETSLPIERVFRLIPDADIMPGAEDHPLLEVLLQTVNSWELASRRAFVQFCTGSHHLPLRGTQALHVRIARPILTESDARAALQALPESHTCDNSLELPDYLRALRVLHPDHSAASLSQRVESILPERLRMAVDGASGYALDTFDRSSE